MTSVKLLFSLQEFDLQLDVLDVRITEVELELNARAAVGEVENSLGQQVALLGEVQDAHKTQQIEAEDLKERSTLLEAQLYSGEITNPRDLSSLELETGNVKAQIDQKEIGLLELAVRADDLRRSVGELEDQLETSRAEWEVRRSELTTQAESLTAEKDELNNRRNEFASSIDQSEMGHYEHLRQSKGGTAVAKVERGLCQACRLSLPTQHLQRVKSGKQTVLGSSCGRMLLLG